MKRLSIALLLTVIFSTGFSQAKSKTDNIQTLLELTGSGKLGMQVMQNMLASFKQTYPDVPEKFWKEFMKEVNADALNKMVIPIYEKYYTELEIQQLIAFYQTPLGKKVILTTPQIMQESMQAGQAWGREIAEKVFSNLKAKGYVKEQ
jgi:hypothetical protein